MKKIKLPSSQTGQALLESMVVISGMIALVLVVIDAGIFFCGMQASYQSCVTACRAASIGPPGAMLAGEPKRSAELALASIATSDGPVRVLPTCIVTEVVRTPLPVAPFGGAVDGDVSVTASVDVSLPLTCNLLRRGPITISRTQTFPYSWVLPPATMPIDHRRH